MYSVSSRRGREQKMKKYSRTVGIAGWYKIRTLTRNISIVPCGNPEYRYINISTPSTWGSSTAFVCILRPFIQGLFRQRTFIQGCFGSLFFGYGDVLHIRIPGMLFVTAFVAYTSFSLAQNFGEDNTGGCKAQRRNNSEPKRSQQASIDMNTADTDFLFQQEPS